MFSKWNTFREGNSWTLELGITCPLLGVASTIRGYCEGMGIDGVSGMDLLLTCGISLGHVETILQGYLQYHYKEWRI